jgi:hypothetical protein
MYEDHRQTAASAVIYTQGADARQSHLPGSFPFLFFLSLHAPSTHQ